MNNKQLGFIIVGFSAILGMITYFFNRALNQIVTQSCDHGPNCPMWGSITFHTNITIALMIIVLLIGLYFIFFGDKHDKTTKRKKENKKIKIPPELNPEEKKVMQIIIDEKGTIFQSTLVEKTNYSKVKITRILDKLEGRNIIDRKRRGMTNVVILKHED